MNLTPYRVAVFANRTIVKGRGKRQRTERIGVGWIAWNPELTEHWAHAGRLPGSGSFQWLGLQAAKNAVGEAFLDPTVHQVQIRTEQDRKLAIFNRGFKAFYIADDERPASPIRHKYGPAYRTAHYRSVAMTANIYEADRLAQAIAASKLYRTSVGLDAAARHFANPVRYISGRNDLATVLALAICLGALVGIWFSL